VDLRFLEGIMSTLTIRLDDELDAQLNQLAERGRRTKSDLVREMLRRQVALADLRALRLELLPKAEQAGYLTEDDLFSELS
jgi:predicted transcriptional regulator